MVKWVVEKIRLKAEWKKVTFQEKRQVDEKRPVQYTNQYAVAQLFPDEDPVEDIKGRC